jgi:glutamate N-acetyltransferase / amino-acid N-acetyltransferase
MGSQVRWGLYYDCWLIILRQSMDSCGAAGASKATRGVFATSFVHGQEETRSRKLVVRSEKWYSLGFMGDMIRERKGGTVTSPRGFVAGAAAAAVKYTGRLDLGMLYSEKPCASAAVFTRNKVKAAPILISMKNMENGKARAVVVNSGCANACTGDRGLKDAARMAGFAASRLGIPSNQVVVASTGVIGVDLPLTRIKSGIDLVKLSGEGGHQLARAIMTTDTLPKEIAVSVSDAGGKYVIGGIAKGAGMIHPDMATLLGFIATDAMVAPGFLKTTLKSAVDQSFNLVTVDGDTSTNDMVSIMANGAAGNAQISQRNGEIFHKALVRVCQFLARSIAADGEGATKLIEVKIEGAGSVSDARKIAKTIAGSPLVKSAMHGNDPNWGRVVAALGRSGAGMEEKCVDVFLQEVPVMKSGMPVAFEKEKVSRALKTKNVTIRVCLNIGTGESLAWGCDLSEEYVTINSDYTT